MLTHFEGCSWNFSAISKGQVTGLSSSPTQFLQKLVQRNCLHVTPIQAERSVWLNILDRWKSSVVWFLHLILALLFVQVLSILYSCSCNILLVGSDREGAVLGDWSSTRTDCITVGRRRLVCENLVTLTAEAGISRTYHLIFTHKYTRRHMCLCAYCFISWKGNLCCTRISFIWHHLQNTIKLK